MLISIINSRRQLSSCHEAVREQVLSEDILGWKTLKVMKIKNDGLARHGCTHLFHIMSGPFCSSFVFWVYLRFLFKPYTGRIACIPNASDQRPPPLAQAVANIRPPMAEGKESTATSTAATSNGLYRSFYARLFDPENSQRSMPK